MEGGSSKAISCSIAASGRDGAVEQAVQRRLVDVAADEGLADAARQDEGELARLRLLVAAHVLDMPAGLPGAPVVAAYAAQPHRKVDRRQMPAHPGGVPGRAQAELC